MKRVLVTGATGFVGSRLARYFVEKQYEVHVLVRPTSSLSELAAIQQSIAVHKVNDDVDVLIQLMKNIQPDVVFHLASLFIARHKPEDIAPMIHSNLTFGTHVLEAMYHAGVKHFVNTGTAWEYYHSDTYNPSCLYAATKKAFESLMEYYIQAHEFRAITLKLFESYGPNDPRKKLIPLIAEKAMKNQEVLLTQKDQVIDFVFIDDIVHAYEQAGLQCMELNPALHKRYGIATGSPITLEQLIQTFEDVLKKKINAKWGAFPSRDREIKTLWSSYEKLPNWSPSTDLYTGLKAVCFARDQK